MLSDTERKKLIEEADRARANAYCPYSGFSVGAALLTDEGKIYRGCNIENAAYPAGICAERTAFSTAVCCGEKNFKAIAIAGGPKGKTVTEAYPCGICRQFMNELTDSSLFEVIIVKDEGSYISHTLDELLPYSFGPEALK